MASKREQIMQAIGDRLAQTVGVGGRVIRSQTEPQDRDEMPCITYQWTSERSQPQTVPQMERTLSVEVHVYTRGDAPDELADPIIVSAHSLLMADTSLGGLAIDMQLEDASVEIVAADMPAAKVAHVYTVQFRHSYSDLTN